MVYHHESTPDKDTGWGLIFRLNDLLNAIENYCVAGKYDDWNFKLDRIWINLTYREGMKITRDEKTNCILDMELEETDFEEKEFIDNKIAGIKKDLKTYERLLEKNPDEKIYLVKYRKIKNQLYKTLIIKDIWIRKLMNKNKLYIKELKSNPAGAMWGK